MPAVPTTQVNNYTLGRGSLYFSQFAPGTQTPTGGERFFGDCNAVSFSVKVTEVDHYQSTGGVKEIDASAPLQVDRTGTFTTENVSPENLAMFFLGSASYIATVGASIVGETIIGVALDRYYQLGETPTNPSGNRNISTTTPPVVTNGLTGGALVTYAAGVDYVIDPSSGSLYTIAATAGGTIPALSNLSISYTTNSQTRDQIISGNTPIYGKLRYRANNSLGTNQDAVVPYAEVSPNGEYALIGDKMQGLQFNIKILKKGNFTGGAALYIDGRGY